MRPSPRTELEMTVARSVAEILTDRVTLEIESIDRGGLVLPGSPGYPFVSSALMGPISKDFVAGLHRMCRDLDVPMIDFVKQPKACPACGTYPQDATRALWVITGLLLLMEIAAISITTEGSWTDADADGNPAANQTPLALIANLCGAIPLIATCSLIVIDLRRSRHKATSETMAADSLSAGD